MPLLELTDADLETAARACRALAYRQGEDAKRIDDLTLRASVEKVGKHAAALAEKFEAELRRR